jgi:hypothetical protein
MMDGVERRYCIPVLHCKKGLSAHVKKEELRIKFLAAVVRVVGLSSGRVSAEIV